MKSIAVPARKGGGRHKKSIRHHDLELELAALFSDLSNVYNKTTSLTEKLQLRGCRRSSGETFEIGVLLKNALRIFADALSDLPS